MEPIAAFPGQASVATSEILSRLTIDQSLEKGGSHIARDSQSHPCNKLTKQHPCNRLLEQVHGYC